MLVHSCAKTLAKKFKLRSRKEIFKKFGSTLAPKDELGNLTNGRKAKTVIEIGRVKSLAVKRIFNVKTVKDPLNALKWNLRTAKGHLDSPC